MLSPMRGMAKGYYAKVASSAVVAGTVSSVTGGKFANGALSGAFRFMFNEAMTKAEINVHNENVMRNEQAMQTFKENSAQFIGEVRTNMVDGLQKINTYSSLLSIATTVDGDYIYSAFFTGTAIISEGLLYLIGYENAPIVYQHSYIDLVFTPLMDRYPTIGTSANFVTKTLSD